MALKPITVRREHARFGGISEVTYRTVEDFVKDYALPADIVNFLNQFVELNGLNKEETYANAIHLAEKYTDHPETTVALLRENGASEERIRQLWRKTAALFESGRCFDGASQLYEAGGDPAKAKEAAYRHFQERLQYNLGTCNFRTLSRGSFEFGVSEPFQNTR